MSSGDGGPLAESQLAGWPAAPCAADSVAWRCGLEGSLDIDALRAALTALTVRHDVLRAVFHAGDPPAQAIGPVLPVPLAVHDLRPVSPAERARRGAELVRQEVARPLDPAAGPVFRVSLFRLADDDHELLVTAHRLAFDPASIGVFLDELARHYPAAAAMAAVAPGVAAPGAVAPGAAPGGSPGDPAPAAPSARYADFVAAQRARADGGRAAVLRDFWRERLDGTVAPDLPTDRPRPAGSGAGPAGGDHPGENFTVPLPPHLPGAVAARAREAGVPVAAACLAAFVVLLHRLGAAPDVCVALAAANRPGPEFERLIGRFAGTVVARVRLADDPELGEVLRRAAAATADAQAHGDLPVERVADLPPDLLRARFAAGPAPGAGAVVPGLVVRPGAAIGSGRLRSDLDWRVEDRGGEWVVNVDFRADLFGEPTVSRLISQYQAVLAAVADEPARRLSAVRLAEPPAASAGGSGSVEDVLLAMWAAEFEVPVVAPDDDFFELGGYSMLAAQLCVRIRETFQVDLPLRSFFETPTVAEIADKVRAAATAGGAVEGPIVPRRRDRSLEDLLGEIEGLSDEDVVDAMARLDLDR
jgi:hypothetical protein